MNSNLKNEILDVALIGSGVMSANLGALLKSMDSKLKIELYEVTEDLSHESSNGWNNAGTGHAGICELSYTPDRGTDGKVKVERRWKSLNSLNRQNNSGLMLFVLE